MDLATVVTLEMRGGLANQLFQWAAVRAICSSLYADLVIDDRYVNRPGNRGSQLAPLLPASQFIDRHTNPAWSWAASALPIGLYNKINWRTGRLRRPRTVYATTLAELSDSVKGESHVIARGLFQDTDLLHANRDTLRQELLAGFTGWRDPDLPDEPFAAVHVRRGDYITDPNIAAEFGACEPAYYESALRALSPKMPVVFVSDDADWVDANLTGFARGKWSIQRAASHYSDLYTLALADQLVMSNSTFSWWGYFLGDAGAVYAPAPWFDSAAHEQNLRGVNWTRLDKRTGNAVP